MTPGEKLLTKSAEVALLVFGSLAGPEMGVLDGMAMAAPAMGATAPEVADVMVITAERAGVAVEGTATQTLFRYTNEEGLTGILESRELRPSLKAVNPKDVRYGNGQYLSDIVPGTKTPAHLSREFLGNPFQGARYTHFIEIDVRGLDLIQGRPGVFVVPNENLLDLTGRILRSGAQ